MFNIRLATLSDLPTLRTLWREFLIDANISYPVGIVDQIDDWTRHLAMALATVPQVAFAFLAEAQDEPIGFILYEIQRRALGQPDRYAFVHGCYVREPWRRHGVSSSLCEIACEHGLAQNLTTVEITYAPDNHQWEAVGIVPYELRGQQTIDKLLAGVDKRRARLAAERGNGLDHQPISAEQPEGKPDVRSR